MGMKELSDFNGKLSDSCPFAEIFVRINIA